MMSFPQQCRRTIRPQQANRAIIACQPSGENAAGLIFSVTQTACFLRRVESRIYSTNHAIQ